MAGMFTGTVISVRESTLVGSAPPEVIVQVMMQLPAAPNGKVPNTYIVADPKPDPRLTS